MIIWLTGLSGAGKTTIANELHKVLNLNGINCAVLDGDIMREGLCSDLGFSDEDRSENIRRVAELAKILKFFNPTMSIIVSCISPIQRDRDRAREIIGDGFFEVFVDSPLEVCESRDVKGLYKRARAGEIKNFTGIDSEYQEPKSPDLHLVTWTKTLKECVTKLCEALRNRDLRI